MHEKNGNKDDRARALELAIGQIEKDFGRGAIMRLGEVAKNMAVETIPTGSLALDIALGTGGIPRSRITERFGPERAGKPPLALHVTRKPKRPDGLAG